MQLQGLGNLFAHWTQGIQLPQSVLHDETDTCATNAAPGLLIECAQILSIELQAFGLQLRVGAGQARQGARGDALA